MKFKKILLIFSILISQSISAMDLDLGSNFILEKEYKNYAKITLSKFFQKCYPELIDTKKEIIGDSIVFFPTNIDLYNNLDLCNPGTLGVIQYIQINPKLSDLNKDLFKLGGENVKKMSEKDLNEFCNTNNSIFTEIAAINNLDLYKCSSRNHISQLPMVYSIFSNDSQIMYSTVIFEEFKDYDFGISILFFRNKNRSISAEQFKEFSNAIWRNIKY